MLFAQQIPDVDLSSLGVSVESLAITLVDLMSFTSQVGSYHVTDPLHAVGAHDNFREDL